MAFTDPHLMGWHVSGSDAFRAGLREPAVRGGALGRALYAAERARLQRALAGVAPNGRVLVMGGGDGRLAALVLDLGFRALVSDPDPAARERVVRRLERFGGRARVLYADVQALEESGQHFDAVVCGDGAVPLATTAAEAEAARRLTGGPIVVARRRESVIERLLRALEPRLWLGDRAAAAVPPVAVRPGALRVVMRLRALPLVGGLAFLVCR